MVDSILPIGFSFIGGILKKYQLQIERITTELTEMIWLVEIDSNYREKRQPQRAQRRLNKISCESQVPGYRSQVSGV
jgi:hypothetical protein